MCGIAGYSLEPDAGIARTLAAQALLAGIAERGADAVGYAHRSPGQSGEVHKRRSGASALLRELAVPQDASEVLVHVRDYTKGHPTIEANNHPVRHGEVVGIHNGIIVNDDEIFAAHGFERDDPEMSVDTEAIFALAEAYGSRGATLEELARLDGSGLARRSRAGGHLRRSRGRPSRSGSATARTASSSPRPSMRSRCASTSSGYRCASVSSRKGRCSSSSTAVSRAASASSRTAASRRRRFRRCGPRASARAAYAC